MMVRWYNPDLLRPVVNLRCTFVDVLGQGDDYSAGYIHICTFLFNVENAAVFDSLFASSPFW